MNSQGITHIEKTPQEIGSNVHGQIQNASINLSKNPKTKIYSNVKGDYKQHITIFSSPNRHWKEKNVFQVSTYIGSLKGKLEPLMPLTRCTFQSRRNIKKKDHKDSKMHLGLHYATYWLVLIQKDFGDEHFPFL